MFVRGPGGGREQNGVAPRRRRRLHGRAFPPPRGLPRGGSLGAALGGPGKSSRTLCKRLGLQGSASRLEAPIPGPEEPIFHGVAIKSHLDKL